MEDIKIQLTPTVTAAISHYQALKDRALSDLEIFLNRPVGVGGHATTTDDIIKLFEELERADSMVKSIKSIILVEEKTEK
tara:strand:- start:10460 stop:10699 length:240 start_codon:yes stop_codon:yes gene_type:complete